jgi:hypothetical protein
MDRLDTAGHPGALDPAPPGPVPPEPGETGEMAAPSVPRRAGPSVRPALVVVGIAAGLVLLFGIGAALTGGSSPAPSKAPTTVRGTSLTAEPASSALAPVEVLGTPPADILSALVLPKGATRLSSTPWDGETQFSATVHFSLPTTQASVIAFYKAELAALGWSISSTGAARGQAGATEVLAQKASSDGWYWEVGVVVSPTTFGTGAVTDTTRFSLDLYEVPDAQ